MAVCKCKMCGGDLAPEGGGKLARCEYCGTVQTLPAGDDERKLSLFNRANKLRLSCEFDKAAAVYEKLIAEFPADAEAYWGLCLCKYGIEYVDDPKTGEKVPTCHRASYEAITADADYRAVLENADAASRPVYERQAAQIDTLQRSILEIVKNEKPFDVFICYKETDDDGRRTPDSVLANDVYYQLTAEGLKVFYAAITLESKLGQAYEPYIFAALHSAKVMLVLGTEPEYFTSVWVKNEWSRFLKLMKTDRSKLLIPCYKNMDAYDLPEEFSHLQAQDMSKIGFMNDVIRGVKKVTAKDEPKPAVIKETVTVQNETGSLGAILDRGFLALEDGEWAKADGFFEQALNFDAKNAQAYLGKLLAAVKTRARAELKNCAQPFDADPNYRKAVRFGDAALKNELEDAVRYIKDRNETARRDGIYAQAERKLNEAKTEADFTAAAEIFRSISGYKDADARAEAAETARKEFIYAQAEQILKSAKNESGYSAAAAMFRTVPGFKDADEQAAAAEKKAETLRQKIIQDKKKAAKRKRITWICIAAAYVALVAGLILNAKVIQPNKKYNAAVKLMQDGRYNEAISAFEAMNGYRDSAAQINETKYLAAVKVMQNGKYSEAISAFEALNGYKDSAAQIEKAKPLVLKNANVGDIVTFGSYEQDNNTSNGKETIEWQVLAKEGSRLLVVSKYALDCQPYNTSYADVTWETCSLRKWLNGTFLNAAFSAEEQKRIPTVTVTADKKPGYGTDPGSNTNDKVFLQSITEVNKYFSSDKARICGATDYAEAQGADTNTSYSAGGKAACWWWLRSPGNISNLAAYVDPDGYVYDNGYNVGYSGHAVRPAMWIDLG